MALDAEHRGVLTFDQMMRMLTRLVPWNDANQIRSVAANICPELLMPQAVIDVKNLVILDERVDIMGCNVNSFKVAKEP